MMPCPSIELEIQRPATLALFSSSRAAAGSRSRHVRPENFAKEIIFVKNIAPDIFRQRLLMEAFYTIDVSRENLAGYLVSVAKHLGLRTYGQPVIFSPASGVGKEENQGFDAFLPLIDSGISAYVWSKAKFISIVLFTCKEFDQAEAIAFTKRYYAVSQEMVSRAF
jgi:S-adenosylmethionine decarboxylase